MIYLTTAAVVANIDADAPEDAERRLRAALEQAGFTVLDRRELPEITLGATESEADAQTDLPLRPGI